MLSGKLFTLLGLAISSVTAAGVSLGEQDLAKQFTAMVCQPVEHLPSADVYQGLHEEAATDPSFFFRNFNAAVKDVKQSLQDLDHEYSPQLIKAIALYHQTLLDGTLPRQVFHDRLSIYQNAIYSILVDMSKKFPNDWQANMSLAITKLQGSLDNYASDFLRMHTMPMGSPKAQESFSKVFQQFHSQLKQVTAKFADLVTKRKAIYPEEQLTSIKYEELEKLNAQLAKTNGPNVPKARLVDRNLWELVRDYVGVFDHIHSHPSNPTIGHVHHVHATPAPVTAAA